MSGGQSRERGRNRTYRGNKMVSMVVLQPIGCFTQTQISLIRYVKQTFSCTILIQIRQQIKIYFDQQALFQKMYIQWAEGIIADD